MSLARKQKESLKALKAFNNAVTTSRLYPANSPQVSNTVERAYQTLKNFAKEYGELSFGGRDDSPRLGGTKVDEKIHAELTELVIYRHLNLLKLDNVVFLPTFDRDIFSIILSAFVARKEAIDREGGGRPFVNSLGLEQYFPDEYSPQDEVKEPTESADVDLRLGTPSIGDDLLGYLFGKNELQDARASLQLIMTDKKETAGVILAGVTSVLREAEKKKDNSSPFISGSYTRFFDNIGIMLQAGQEEVISEAVRVLQTKLNEQMLATICAQKYSEGFGKSFSSQLFAAMPNEQFDAVMRQLHRWVRQYVRQKTTNTAEARIVGMTLKNLLATTRGKQFVGREKARSLMRSGEQQRKEKRIETGIGALLSGGNASLRSDEVLSGLSSQIKKLVKQDREGDVARLLEALSNEALKSDESDLKRLMGPVVSSGVMLLEMERWTLLDPLAEALLLWTRTSNEGDGLYKKSILLLQTIMSKSWDSGNYARGDRILSVFHKIRTGQMVKDHAVIELVGLIQDRSYNRPFYQTLLDQFLAEGGDVNAGQRLIMMGRPSGDFIVEKLLQEEEPANRLKIVDLLGDMGPVARELIIEKLPEPMPWYGKRNLIKLAGVMAGPEQIEAILPFLRHDDIRVQREAFVSIYTISGDQRKQALIRCLSESSEVMLIQVVKALLPYSDDETTRHLGTLLQDQENYSADIREPLILQTVKVLSRSSSVAGRDALLSFLDTQKKKINRRLNPAVWQAAELALKKVEQGLEDAVPSAEITQKERSSASASSAAGRSNATIGLPEEETQDITEMPGYLEIRQFVEQDNIDSAKESLLKLIGDMAAKRRFQDAETLRAWLVEIDPMALSEIIRAAEIIEEEKIATVEQVDIEAWSDLYDELSTEEFATFIHATERKIYSNEAAVFQQGDTQSGLYFINSGSVKVFYQDQAGEKLIKTAVKGDILGADTVVDATVWTASATCLNQAEIMYLAGSELLKWRDEYPSLETKIDDFCREYASLEQFFRSTENDRRGAVRHNLSGKISSVLLDDRWRDTGFSTQGDLSDVSRGGLSFFMRISQKKHARVLLGRNIRVMIPMEGAAGLQIDVLGTIIAVRSRQSVENEYSIHVKFNDDLQSVDLQTIIKTNA